VSIQYGRIDVHHHLIPPPFKAAMERRGIDKVAGAPLPMWTPQHSLDVMDCNGIQTAIVSLSAPGTWFDDRDEACALARQCNEYAARMRQDYSGRFGFFAVLPMPFTAQACAEAIYALDHLKADGVVLLGSTGGHFLGSPEFDELMAELDRRRTTVFVHPNMHATSESLGLDMPGFLIEFLCDTTRAALNLILKGTMDRYPHIRWILAHAGGFLPYVAWRVSLANTMPNQAPLGVLHYLRQFFFDTALSPSAYSMATLKELVDPSHILFGSDFPFAPAPATALQCATLEKLPMWDPAAKRAIDRNNALQLFPQYRMPEEEIHPATSYSGETTRLWLRRQMARPMAAIAEHMRNR